MRVISMGLTLMGSSVSVGSAVVSVVGVEAVLVEVAVDPGSSSPV